MPQINKCLCKWIPFQADLLVSSLSSDDLAGVIYCFVGPKPLKRSDESALTIFIRKLNRTLLTEALDNFNNKVINYYTESSHRDNIEKIFFVGNVKRVIK